MWSVPVLLLKAMTRKLNTSCEPHGTWKPASSGHEEVFKTKNKSSGTQRNSTREETLRGLLLGDSFLFLSKVPADDRRECTHLASAACRRICIFLFCTATPDTLTMQQKTCPSGHNHHHYQETMLALPQNMHLFLKTLPGELTFPCYIALQKLLQNMT